MKIPVMKPILPSAEMVYPYLQSMDSNRYYSNNGPLLNSLEERFAVFLDVPANRVVCSANATLSIMGVARILEGDEIFVPSFTFPGTIHAAIYSGKKVKMADIDSNTWMLNYDENNHNSSGGIVLSVLPFGSRPDTVTHLKNSMNLFDAAASIGNYQGKLTGIRSNEVYFFSLHATKVLGIGEGAVTVFGSAETAKQFRSWINFGFEGTRISKSLATNAKMSEISASYGHAALDQWKTERTEWIDINNFQREIEIKFGIGAPFSSEGNVSPYWICQFADTNIRNKVEKVLLAEGVETRNWWGSGCHTMPAFSQFRNSEYPETELIASKTLGMPKYRDLRLDEMEFIDHVLESIL
jgi:dTDP-4-amino-4,6-dideoxygalactose transaminase